MRDRLDSPAILSRLHLFPPLPGHPSMVDASVTYYTWWQAPLQIYFAAPDPSKLRFVVIFRDAVDRFYSHYSMAATRKGLPSKMSFPDFAQFKISKLDKCMGKVLSGHEEWER